MAEPAAGRILERNGFEPIPSVLSDARRLTRCRSILTLHWLESRRRPRWDALMAVKLSKSLKDNQTQPRVSRRR